MKFLSRELPTVDMLVRSEFPGAGGALSRKAGVMIGLDVAASLGPAFAEERCGWLENPTAGNWC